uniref:Uncharacterized protein n=1 Tax=Oryza glumipatula TaxID=40148 RepID=A0A0D9YNR6_9ORYZ
MIRHVRMPPTLTPTTCSAHHQLAIEAAATTPRPPSSRSRSRSRHCRRARGAARRGGSCSRAPTSSTGGTSTGRAASPKPCSPPPTHAARLEAAADAGGAHRRVLHIVDLDAAHGVQWPPLLQAIADRADPAVGPPPEVRLTGAGTDRDVLLRTGDRLRAFSSSLNLPFRFHPLILPCTAELAADPTAALELHPDETLAVNCVLFLHKLGGDGELAAFLRWVKSMNPAVVTIAEREGVLGGDVDDDNVPDELPRRVAAAMDYYSSVFDALEATVPPASADRLAVEQEILSREIDAAVAAPGAGGGGRARDFDAWASAARAAGLAPRPLSAFAASQARLLLRLHYPSEGYKADDDGGRGACFLRWQQRPLMSVSSWQPQP